MSKKVCKKCKYFVKGNECPICKGDDFEKSWKGRVYIVDTKKSKIADRIGAKIKGEYALRI